MLLTLTFIFTIWLVPLMVETTDIVKSLPKQIEGWKAMGKTETYNRETIYDYMDGAGEIYLAYDFRLLLVQRYVKAQNPDITVEIFDMGSGEDAFGVFSHTQGRSKEMGIGQDSEYRGGLLCLWKDRFFVCVRTGRETPSSKRAVFSLGRTISKTIKVKVEKPALLKYLPNEGLLEKGIRYFHKHDILNYHYFVSDRNILNLNTHTNAVLASYKDRSHILLVEYQNKEKAKTGFKDFINAYMPDADEGGIIQTEDGRWTAIRLEQNFLVIAFDAISKTNAIFKVDATINKLKGFKRLRG